MKKMPNIDEKTKINLVKKAREATKYSYAPYSKFHVGCAVLLEDGRIFSGVNIENASYSVTLCAERAAMAQVITEGLQSLIKAIAVVTPTEQGGSPCGVCRQFLCEFLPKDTPIFLGNKSDDIREVAMGELLPLAFEKHMLER